MHFDIKKGGDYILRAIAEEPSEAPLRWQADVISRALEERLIVAYTLYREETKVERLIGKFYALGVGQSAYRVMNALQQALARDGGVSILAAPDPLFYDDDLDLIVQQFVEGVPYYDLIERDHTSRYFQEAGKALAILHNLDLEYGPPRILSTHLDELIHPHPVLFAKTMPAYHATIERLIQEMNRMERFWGKSIETTPIHRDFHLKQLFHGKGRVWLIDWDLFAMGDPALDVGNFIVYLETHLKTKCKALIAAFLEGYFSIAPPSRLERVPLYKGFTYLRLACKRFRLKEDHWPEMVAEMLRLSEAALKETGNDATG